MNKQQRVNFTGSKSGRGTVAGKDYASDRTMQSWNRSKSNRSNILGDVVEGDPLILQNTLIDGESGRTAAASGGGGSKNNSPSLSASASSSSSSSSLSSYWDSFPYCLYGNSADDIDGHQKQGRGFGSLLVSMVMLTLFGATLVAAIQHVSKDDTNMMMKAAKQLAEAKLHTKSNLHDLKRGENVNSHDLSHVRIVDGSKDVNIIEMKGGSEMEMEGNGEKHDVRQMRIPTICTVNAPGAWNLKMNQRCPHELTKISVPSMGEQNDFRWPENFSWTILRDDDETDETSSSSTSISKQFLASVTDGNVDHLFDQDNKCDEYVTELCLDGTYVIYANSDEVDDIEKIEGKLLICDKDVRAGEALDFSIKDNFCFMDSYEDRKKTRTGRMKTKTNKEMKTASRLTKDSSMSMSMSYSFGGSLSAIPVPPPIKPSPSRPSNDDEEDDPSDNEGDDDGGHDTQPTVPPTGSLVSPDTEETLDPLINNSFVHAIKNFTDTYLTPFPSAAPTPSVSTAFFNNSDNCYSLPGLPKIYCYNDYQTSFPTPLPTEGVPRAPTKCMFFGLFGGDCGDTEMPTSMPTTRIMNPEINQEIEDDVVAQEDEDTHDATKIEEKEQRESQKKVMEAGHEVQTEVHRQKRNTERSVHKTEVVIARERKQNEDEIANEKKNYERTYEDGDKIVSFTSPSAPSPPVLTPRQQANEIEKERDEEIAKNVKTSISHIYDSLADKVMNESDTKGYMMSLQGADKNTPYSLCMSKYEHPMNYLDVEVAPGCISLFTNDVNKQMYSYVTTFCGCKEIGPRMYDINALIRSRLVNKDNQQSAISFIATGEKASIAFYNSPKFATDEKSSEYKDILGPERRISLESLNMGDSGRSWDDQVYSIILDSWSSCDSPAVSCNDVTTQAPVSDPTQAPRSDNIRATVKVSARDNDAADRLAEIEGEKDPEFVEFVSQLGTVEDSFLYSHEAVEKSTTLSSPLLTASDFSGGSMHPMALQVEGKEAINDERSSAYFEDEVDPYDNGRRKHKKNLSTKGEYKHHEYEKKKKHSRRHLRQR